MSLQENVLGFVNPRGERARSASVRVQPLDEVAVGLTDGLLPRPRLKPQDVISFLLGHRARLADATAPRVRIRLSVLTPSGKPAIHVSL